jgi:hypothetical protein
VYFSSRLLSRISRIDYATGNVVYNMGQDFPSGDVDFGDGLFERQHSPQLLPSGNMMVFDNGPVGGPSYAIELAFTGDPPTSASIVWQWQTPEAVGNRGDADRLANGNTLVTAGPLGTIFEVDPLGTELWSLQITGEATDKAERIPHLIDPGPGCDDGWDNDGDGLVDLADLGCDDAADPSEKSALLACDDGWDNDGDGRTDFDPETFANPGDEASVPAGSGDPGCKDPSWSTESPQCQDGINNDLGQDSNPGYIDYDAGYSANGSPDPDGPDPQCVGKPWKDREAVARRRCGLGYELVFLLPPLMWLLGRRRRSI